jgi:hypothetical protein
MQKQVHHYPQNKTRFRSPYRPDGYFIVTKGKAYPRNGTTDLGGGSLMATPFKKLCVYCRTAHKVSRMSTDTCPICGNILYMVPPRARVPRKLASDKIWEKFIARFAKKIQIYE